MKQKKWHSARPGGMPLFLLSAPILPAFLFLVPAARAQLVLMLIFFFRRHPAPDMAFRFVDVQYYTRPGCKRRIDMGKALGHIFMHGRFTDPKFPGRLPHCRILVYDVISDRNRPFLDIFLHGSSPENVFYILLHLFPVYANSLSQTKTLPISSSPHGGVSASRFSSRQLPTLPSPHRSRQAVPELPSDARFHPALP